MLRRFCPLLATMMLAAALNAQEHPPADSQPAQADATPTSQPSTQPAGLPTPDYTGGLFSRSTLTGDWGGLRQRAGCGG